jgi:hypothetical protein
MADCRWVGIDLHRSRSHVAVLDDDGSELRSRRIVNDPRTFLELLAEIDGESKIALEATYGWERLADLLVEAAYVPPRRARAFATAATPRSLRDPRPCVARRSARRWRSSKSEAPPAAPRSVTCPSRHPQGREAVPFHGWEGHRGAGDQRLPEAVATCRASPAMSPLGLMF